MKYLLKFLSIIINLFKKPVEQKNDNEVEFIPVPPIDEKEDKETPKYLWGNPAEVRHSIRVIGDEEGLNWEQKNLLCDIAFCESGFAPRAMRVNSINSVDRGLYQINSYWHPKITDEMAYDPEFSTRWACKAMKSKQVNAFWSASEKCWNVGGKYKKLL